MGRRIRMRIVQSAKACLLLVWESVPAATWLALVSPWWIPFAGRMDLTIRTNVWLDVKELALHAKAPVLALGNASAQRSMHQSVQRLGSNMATSAKLSAIKLKSHASSSALADLLVTVPLLSARKTHAKVLHVRRIQKPSVRPITVEDAIGTFTLMERLSIAMSKKDVSVHNNTIRFVAKMKRHMEINAKPTVKM